MSARGDAKDAFCFFRGERFANPFFLFVCMVFVIFVIFCFFDISRGSLRFLCLFCVGLSDTSVSGSLGGLFYVI